MKKNLFLVFATFLLIIPAASQSQTLDYIKDQIIPKDVAERPPEASYSDEFERDTFTKENFYNKTAGTRQYRRSMMAPTKSMEFEVINPLDQEKEDEGPTTNTHVVEKDGRAVTVISIKEDTESDK